MEEYISIIATHQARIRCFINNLLEKYNLKTNNHYNKNNEIYRFKNSCILKITITNKETVIELFHDGEVDEEKPDYVYFSNLKNDNLQQVLDYQNNLRYSQKNFKTISISEDVFGVNDNKYTFYLLRHGQGYHNTLKKGSEKIQSLYLPGFREKILDASLTNEGEKQAKSAGDKLNSIKFTHYFASDLKRTRQTLLNAFENLDEKEIIILPCNHEVNYPNCDKLSLITPNENVSSCQKDNAEGCGKANWNYYKEKYNKNYRSSISSIPYRDCSNTDIISEAIKIIEIIKNENKQKGGYFKKYLKYKHKYLKLKNNN